MSWRLSSSGEGLDFAQLDLFPMQQVVNLRARKLTACATNSEMMNVQAYLSRLNYDGPLEPNADTLCRLQVAHLLAVPFENLSIHADEPIVLDDEALFRKIVEGRRGGFCYELNGLFSALLRSSGFKVSMLSAQVANTEGAFGPEFDHMALLVTLEDPWLVDVGFGDSFVEPLRLSTRDPQTQRDRSYRIDADSEGWVMWQQKLADEKVEWEPQYRFTLKSYQYSDYAARCEYHQKSPLSHFTRSRICSRLTARGRITLTGTSFITTEGAERNERAVSSQAEYADLLSEHFGIVMA
jgi:N-hydroxyarylamine O-acetyltransferase